MGATQFKHDRIGGAVVKLRHEVHNFGETGRDRVWYTILVTISMRKQGHYNLKKKTIGASFSIKKNL